MGQKVHPKIFRIGVIFSSSSKWFAPKEKFRELLKEDVRIRKFLKEKLKDAGVASIEIERSSGSINVIIYSSKPGIIIGRGGADIEKLKQEVHRKFLGSKKIKVNISIQEVSKPDINAQLISRAMVEQIQKRLPTRQIMKRTIEQMKRGGALGGKVTVAGRINGAEIARTESLAFGSLPLHTLRANIDYARDAAHTTYGAVGVKVWIYKGEVFNKDSKDQEKEITTPSKR